MNTETCLLTHFIRNNKIVSSCDFVPPMLANSVIIYEVIRVIDTTPLFFNEHVERFYNSIAQAGYKTILSKDNIALRIKALIETNKLVDGNIKFQINFTIKNTETFTAWLCPFFYPTKELYGKGIAVETISAHRNNPNIKAGNLQLTEVVNSIFSSNKSIYEVLLVNSEGIITEGSRSNIFFIENNNIYTPLIETVLPGITRQKVMQASKKIGIKCHETSISLDNIAMYQGAFITGTSPKVLPINKINNTIFNPNNPILKKIMNEYDLMIDKDIQSFVW
ncbi:MAG: aminotransferase class IV [Bacteroidota bacterium]